jgi:hypothetical protein
MTALCFPSNKKPSEVCTEAIATNHDGVTRFLHPQFASLKRLINDKLGG